MNTFVGWRGWSVFKSAEVLSEDPARFSSHHPHRGAQPSITLILGNPRSSSGLLRHYVAYTCRRASFHTPEAKRNTSFK